MPAAQQVVAWDADGVLVNSDAAACRAAEDIVGLFRPGVRISSRREYRNEFGRDAQARLVGAAHASALRAMHRLVMRARAADLRVFDDCVRVLRLLRNRPILITAAFADGIRHALGAHTALFRDIRGREVGNKEELLAAAAGMVAVYITDTVADINRCRKCGIEVIAVTWGYDNAEDLRSARPDALAHNPTELEQALSARSLLTNGGLNAP